MTETAIYELPAKLLTPSWKLATQISNERGMYSTFDTHSFKRVLTIFILRCQSELDLPY